MNRIRKFSSFALTVATSLPLVAQTEPPQATKPGPSGPTQEQEEIKPAPKIEIDDAIIALSTDGTDGIPIEKFVRLASKVTGKKITYGQDLTTQPDGAIRFVGTLNVPREDYFGFFKTMMLQKGFACAMRGEGASEIVELIAMNGPKFRELASSARFVPSDELETVAGQNGSMIITTIELGHVGANAAVTLLRPLLANSSLRMTSIGNGNKLILQGFATEVQTAVSMLAEVDQPSESDTADVHVIRLQHVAAAPLAQTLNQLAAATPGAPQTIAEPQTGSLLLRGSQQQVAMLTKLVTALDVPAQDVDTPREGTRVKTSHTTIDGDDIVLSMDPDKPMRLMHLLMLAHEVTGDVFTLTGSAAKSARDHIPLIGTLQLKKSAFQPFFTSLLEAHGFTCERYGGDAGLFVEVRRGK